LVKDSDVEAVVILDEIAGTLELEALQDTLYKTQRGQIQNLYTLSIIGPARIPVYPWLPAITLPAVRRVFTGAGQGTGWLSDTHGFTRAIA
jgi:hypothetical protein